MTETFIYLASISYYVTIKFFGIFKVNEYLLCYFHITIRIHLCPDVVHAGYTAFPHVYVVMDLCIGYIHIGLCVCI